MHDAHVINIRPASSLDLWTQLAGLCSRSRRILRMTSEVKLETAKFDARFPNTNQTKNCWTNFRDYHRCVKARGVDYDPCQWFKKTYASLCPLAWVEAWDEQVEAGTFAGKI